MLAPNKIRDAYRSRYTALDVAWELGLFEDLVAEVFEKIWV